MYMQIINECIVFINENIKNFHAHDINSTRIVNKNISDCFTDRESNELYTIICRHRRHFVNIDEIDNLQEKINKLKIAQNCSFYYRIKSGESLNSKIIKNMHNELHGKVSLQKTINDLIGFRITIVTNKNIEEIFEVINNTTLIKISKY